jgi:hypothetical protein
VAGDLIPPPSPAGRPDPNPEPGALPAGPAAEPPAPATASAPAGPSPYFRRFGFLAGVLLGVAACAAAAFVLLLAAGPPADRVHFAEHWSAWTPATGDPVDGAADIARRVQAEYGADAQHRLVTVKAGPLEFEGLPTTVDLRPGDGTLRDLASDGVLFTLRGSGPHAEIAGGTPPPREHALLRREALELALYSFRYLDGVDSVLALLPPVKKPKGKLQQQAVFYRAGDLRGEMEIPLAATLVPRRLTPSALEPADRRRVDALTLGNTFTWSLQVGQDGHVYVLLARPRA